MPGQGGLHTPSSQLQLVGQATPEQPQLDSSVLLLWPEQAQPLPSQLGAPLTLLAQSQTQAFVMHACVKGSGQAPHSTVPHGSGTDPHLPLQDVDGASQPASPPVPEPLDPPVAAEPLDPPAPPPPDEPALPPAPPLEAPALPASMHSQLPNCPSAPHTLRALQPETWLHDSASPAEQTGDPVFVALDEQPMSHTPKTSRTARCVTRGKTGSYDLESPVQADDLLSVYGRSRERR